MSRKKHTVCIAYYLEDLRGRGWGGGIMLSCLVLEDMQRCRRTEKAYCGLLGTRLVDGGKAEGGAYSHAWT